MQKRHQSVLPFFALVLALSLPFWALGAINPIELLPGVPISALGAFVPALAALLLIYKEECLSGVLQLLERSLDFKRIENKSWYLPLLLINPAIAVLAYAALRIEGIPLPNPSVMPSTALGLFVLMFIAALGEEIGWSGYATEPMERRLGLVMTGILLGLAWAVWHIIPLIQAHRPAEWIAWWSLGTLSIRTIMVWLYMHSGKSVFALAVFHALINLCWQLFPVNGSYYDPRVFAMITLVLAIAIIAGRRLPVKRKMQAA